MIAEFKDGEMALRPSPNPGWHHGSFNGATVAADHFDSGDAAAPVGQRAMARLARLARSAIRPYGTALFLVAAALISTLLLRGLFPYPFLYLFFPAVMASAWLGGKAVGLFAVFLSTLGVAYFFVPPFYSFSINATDTAYFAAFIVCALVASWVSASKKKSEEALTEARDLLEYSVNERTAELRKSNAELRRIIEEHRKAQQTLMKTQAELAHLSRVFTMGELTSSIAHEVNQPLTAVVTNGHACMEWLSANPPDLGEARQSAERIIEDGTRAGKVLGRICSLFKKEALARDRLNMNDVIQELTVFLRGEAMSQRISLRTDLAADLPCVRGDHVQLQQVVLNLIMNGIEAMRGTADRPKEIWIRSRREDSAGVRIAVEDRGVGLSPEIAEKIFQPFFTTKDQGIGMGLSISRSIVESHAGRLWAAPGPSGGASFQFTIPPES
jgi:C4-dicarboxylate-specific signal transduction histidine kinase